jgi:hypothetical protein
MGKARVAAQDPRPVLRKITDNLDGEPDARDLRKIRTILDDPAFLSEMSDYLKGVNDPDIRAEIVNAIIAISRECSDRAADRKNGLTNIRYGIGGGIALTASGLLGMATGGAALIIAVFAGVWVAGMSVSKTGPMAEEEQIYNDMAARTQKIRDKFDVV